MREQLDVMDRRLDLSESFLTFPPLTSSVYRTPLKKVQETREQFGFEGRPVQGSRVSPPSLLYTNTESFFPLTPGNTKVYVSSTAERDFKHQNNYSSINSSLYFIIQINLLQIDVTWKSASFRFWEQKH